MNNKSNPNHWQKHSLNWEILGSPLRPNAEDMSFVTKGIFPILKLKASPVERVVILGVISSSDDHL